MEQPSILTAWTAGSRRRSRSSARVACSSTCAVRARCRRDARGSSPSCKATSSRRAPTMATSSESGPWSGKSGPSWTRIWPTLPQTLWPWAGRSGRKERSAGHRHRRRRRRRARARTGSCPAAPRRRPRRHRKSSHRHAPAARHPANARGIRSSRLQMPKPPAQSWSPGRLTGGTYYLLTYTGRTRRRASRGSVKRSPGE